MNFDGNTNNCLSIINPGTGNAWTIDVTPTDVANGTFTGNVMKYGYNSSDAANTWFFTGDQLKCRYYVQSILFICKQ